MDVIQIHVVKIYFDILTITRVSSHYLLREDLSVKVNYVHKESTKLTQVIN